MINQKRTESVAGMIMLHIAGAISLAELAIDDPTVDLAVLKAHLQVGAAESGTVLEQAIWETHKDMFDEELNEALEEAVEEIEGLVITPDPDVWTKDS